MDAVLLGIGAGISLLMLLLFTALRIADIRKRVRPLRGGEWINAIGFGLLPGIAVWKIFEQGTRLAAGTDVFEPLPVVPFLTTKGMFAPCRIEMAAALICFAGIVIWLICRKEDLPGNGDLLFAVLCVWGWVRGVTESFRADPLLRIGELNPVQAAFLLLAVLCLLVWSIRREKTQKSAAMTALEWLAVLSCGSVIVLQTAGILSVGSSIGDLAVLAGCGLLGMILVLLAGKDSRAA